MLALGVFATSCGVDPTAATLGGASSSAVGLASEAGAEPCYKLAARRECGVVEPARAVRVTHRAPCRREEFGLEAWWVESETTYETADHVMAGDQCTAVLDVSGPALFFREKHQECLAIETAVARARLGPHARVECITPGVSSCYHDGPRWTRFNYLYRVQTLLPLWHEREDDPLCPSVGPDEAREERPAQLCSCRHPLNGLADDPAECRGDRA